MAEDFPEALLDGRGFARLCSMAEDFRAVPADG